MSSLAFLQAKRAEILRVAALRGGHNVRVFGSAARGDEAPARDIDFLIEFEESRSILDLAGLWQDLEELLGRKVDVAEPEGPHWHIRDRVLKEAVPL